MFYPTPELEFAHKLRKDGPMVWIAASGTVIPPEYGWPNSEVQDLSLRIFVDEDTELSPDQLSPKELDDLEQTAVDRLCEHVDEMEDDYYED